MRTKLVIQLFSKSVANSLRFLKLIGIILFNDIEATAKFCETIDAILFLLNSRSPNAGVNRRAIDKSMFASMKGRILGLIIDLDVRVRISEELLYSEFPLDDVAPYYWCQDLLEQFFSVIRAGMDFPEIPYAGNSNML
jgi:hypothetical protein